MRIGVDFDNTIVCYDGVFYEAAKMQCALPTHLGRSKTSVRDYLRSIGQENLWIELQGAVYGSLMHLASPFPDVETFLHSAKHELFIVSHKTLHPYKGPQYNLHTAARGWLSARSFPPPAFFELTLKEKLQRIETLRCDYFIDDLPELLLEPSFPKNVQKILFDPTHQHAEDSRYLKFSSWKELIQFFETPHG
jgi:hypothetical protein